MKWNGKDAIALMPDTTALYCRDESNHWSSVQSSDELVWNVLPLRPDSINVLFLRSLPDPF